MKNGSGDNHDGTAFKGELLLRFSINCVSWGLCFSSLNTGDQHVSHECLTCLFALLPLCILRCILIRIESSYG
jgi:hypothetical protein